MTAPKKAKRVLKNIDFSGDGAHISFVGPDVGGPANLQAYALVMKSTANFSEEVIEKMSRISVEYELPDFLRKVMGMYWEEAEVLARMLGYEADEESVDSEYRDWIEDRLESYTVMKSLHEAESLAEAVSKLGGDAYLALLLDQERVEKALKNKASLDSERVAKAAEQPLVATKPKARVVKKATENAKAVVEAEPNKVVKAAVPEVKEMTDKVTVVEQTIETEMVSKSQFDEIQKAFDAQKEMIEKANALIAQFEAEKKEAVAKARKAELVAAVEQEEKAEALFKAVGDLSDEAFASVVEVVKGLAIKVESDPLFIEKGVSVEGEAVVADTKTILKQRLAAQYAK